jgi:hypothetical protein
MERRRRFAIATVVFASINTSSKITPIQSRPFGVTVEQTRMFM